jgi:serine/threonine protein kinase/Tfp pilus assembly protein PilF
VKQDNQVQPNSDPLAIADTQFNNQELLSEDEQTAQLNNSSMAHFKIIDILGKGGMGAVYKAKDLALERFVAIKTLRISRTEQPLILAEAKTISKLNHPNIVTIYDIARDGDANFIVMEWVDGNPLNTAIPSQGMALNKVLDYAKQMVAALACAHQQQIIHHDIKPQNIMLDVNGRIKILDFGIAALIEPEEPLANQEPLANKEPSANQESIDGKPTPQPLAPALAVVGSPQYMSPEKIQGLVSDTRSDLFSLGIVLYEMLTGVKPFLGLNIKQISQAISHGKYTPLAELKPQLPPELIAVVDQLLQKSPAERYQTAKALGQDIEAIAEKINHKKNWWQQQHWLTQAFLILPIIAMLGWSIRSVLFPPSTQDLIARQLVESKKIAFLPFDNISGDPVLQIFSDGIATMLSSDLAEVGYQQGDGSTWVLPANEIRNLEDPSVAGIYNKYGVDFIITGSIQHMGSTRSIHLSLVNGVDGRQLKSKQLTIDANKLFEAQIQIRQQVMTLLGWKIPAALNQQFSAQKPAFDGAYKHYLQGQGYLYRFDHGDNINKALGAFQAAIDIDPNYADAYVGLAEAQLRNFIESNDVKLLLPMVDTVEQLTQIDSTHPLLSYLEAELKLNQGDYINAVNLFKKSIQQQVNFLKAYTGLSFSYKQLDLLDESEKILLQAYELMPNNNAVLTDLGILHFGSGGYDRAIEFFELLAEQTPNNYMAQLNISACHYLNGNINEAILSAQKSIVIQPNYIAYSNIGTSYFHLKKYDKAVIAFEQMIGLNDSDYINWGNLADAYRFANNDKYLSAFKQAILLAEQALELNSSNKYTIASLAYYYANLSNIEKSITYAKKITEKDSGENQFFIAATYARLNIKPTAIKYLALAINNSYSIAEIATSPLLDGLKSEEKYWHLIKTDFN